MNVKGLLAGIGVVVLVLGCARQATAQAAPGTYADPYNPSGAPDPTKLDQIWQVDPITGLLSVTIPFTTTPQGGRGPKIPFSLHYNSASTVTLQSYSLGNFRWTTGSISPAYGPVGPWTSSGPFFYTSDSSIPNQPSWTTVVGNTDITETPGANGCDTSGPYIYTDESGAAHDMNLESFSMNNGGYTANQGQCISPQGQDVSSSGTSDGSGLLTFIPTYNSQEYIVQPDGTRVTQVLGALLSTGVRAASGASLEDSNGNIATLSASEYTWTATDSLGRTAFSTTFPINYSGQIPVGTYSLTTSGATGSNETYSMQFGTISIGSFIMPHPVGGLVSSSTNEITGPGGDCMPAVCPQTYGVGQPDGTTLPVLNSVTLPDSTSYSFTYDPISGNISKIVFPTGGYVRFVWHTRSDAGPYGLYEHLSTIVVSEACTSTGSGSESCWQYSYQSISPTGLLTSTVTAPDQSYTQYTSIPIKSAALLRFQFYAALSWKEAIRLEYNSSGTLMKSVQTVYDGTLLPNQVATTLYDGSTPLQQLVQYTHDGFSNVVEKDESDYYSCSGTPCSGPTYNLYPGVASLVNGFTITMVSPPTGWLRRTYTSYDYMDNATTGVYINDKPSQVVVTDVSGKPYSLTTYTYDQSSNIGSGATGFSTHDDTNYSSNAIARGDLTTEKKCISGITFTPATNTNSWSASCGSALNTYYYYDQTGQLTMKKEGGTGPSSPATTQYTWSGTDNGFLTQVQHPDGTTEKFTYYQPTGAVNTHTDVNNQTTVYSYSDPLNRVTSVVLPSTPDGTTGSNGQGATTYTYIDSPGGFSVQEQHLLTGSTWTSTTKYYDGLGRVVETTTAVPATQCSGGLLYTQTAYDVMSRVYSTTNPYC